jgi:hypothetical protein
MKKPRYTDAHKYPRPYRKSTNLAETFRRIRAEQGKLLTEHKDKIRVLPAKKEVRKP